LKREAKNIFKNRYTVRTADAKLVLMKILGFLGSMASRKFRHLSPMTVAGPNSGLGRRKCSQQSHHTDPQPNFPSASKGSGFDTSPYCVSEA
jgi:hypothetical protein